MQDRNYDWGVIQLNERIGDTCGWLGVRQYHDPSSLMHKRVTVQGYAGDYNGRQCYASGDIYGATDTMIAYYIDTKSGQSGAPVYEQDTTNLNDYAVAIHTGAWDDFSFNRATRINERILENLKQFID